MIIIFIEKINGSGDPLKEGRKIKIFADKLLGNKTKSLYVRKGFLHGTLFLSQRGGGCEGASDICRLLLNEDPQHVNSNLFDRLLIYATKSDALIELK